MSRRGSSEGRRRARVVGAALACLASLAGPSAARADTEACLSAYESGQKLRGEGALGAAREAFATCAAPECPDVTKGDCATWLAEVESALPTVVFAVTGEDGADLVDVVVTVDGKKLTERLDGKAVPLDPGPHRLRFEHGGLAPVERDLVVREGEKGRRVEVAFGAASSRGTSPEATSALERISPAAWVLGGVGVVGLGVFGVAGGMFLAERSDVEAACAPSCSDDEVAPLRTKMIVADVGLGVGVAGLAAGVIVAIVTGSSEDTPASSARLDVLTRGDGAAVVLTTTF